MRKSKKATPTRWAGMFSIALLALVVVLPVERAEPAVVATWFTAPILVEREPLTPFMPNQRTSEFEREYDRLLSIASPDCAKLRTSELGCLACNIYHEARGEPFEGQYAVGRVTINRARSDAHPDSICAVVFEKKRGARAQFSWTDDQVSDKVKEAESWQTAVVLAATLLPERFEEDVSVKIRGQEIDGATNFHTRSMKPPPWTRRMTRVAKIGNHVLYEPKEN